MLKSKIAAFLYFTAKDNIPLKLADLHISTTERKSSITFLVAMLDEHNTCNSHNIYTTDIC